MEKPSIEHEGRPLVSCVMPTYDRPRFASQAIKYFQRQDYENKELLVIDDGNESIADLIPKDPQIRYLRNDRRISIGEKLNLGCEFSSGEILMNWDDDDWMSNRRISSQTESLLCDDLDVCGLCDVLFYEPATARGWYFVYPRHFRLWLHGGSLCYLKSFWRKHPYSNITPGVDTQFLWSSRSRKIKTLANATMYVAIVHPGNTCKKQTSESWYCPQPVEKIRSILGDDCTFYDA